MYDIEKQIILKNDIDGRAANHFVYSIASMPFNIKIHKGDKQVNGKSILGLLSIGLKSGDTVQISIDKNDPDGINEIINLINA